MVRKKITKKTLKKFAKGKAFKFKGKDIKPTKKQVSLAKRELRFRKQVQRIEKGFGRVKVITRGSGTDFVIRRPDFRIFK